MNLRKNRKSVKFPKRIDSVESSVDTKFGTIRSAWHKDGNDICYEVDIPKSATLIIGKKSIKIEAGEHKFVNNAIKCVMEK